jgi:hypothetical protein
VEAAGGSADSERGVVFCGAALAAEGSEDCEGVKSVSEASEVDVVADRNAGEDPVPCGGLGGVGVDVDDNQAGGAAGNADT